MVSDDFLNGLMRQTRMSFLDAARTDIKDALSKFTDLSPKAQMHIFPDRTRRNALTLAGTIPISYKVSIIHF